VGGAWLYMILSFACPRALELIQSRTKETVPECTFNVDSPTAKQRDEHMTVSWMVWNGVNGRTCEDSPTRSLAQSPIYTYISNHTHVLKYLHVGAVPCPVLKVWIREPPTCTRQSGNFWIHPRNYALRNKWQPQMMDLKGNPLLGNFHYEVCKPQQFSNVSSAVFNFYVETCILPV
jgi:hypothetical protein